MRVPIWLPMLGMLVVLGCAADPDGTIEMSSEVSIGSPISSPAAAVPPVTDTRSAASTESVPTTADDDAPSPATQPPQPVATPPAGSPPPGSQPTGSQPSIAGSAGDGGASEPAEPDPIGDALDEPAPPPPSEPLAPTFFAFVVSDPGPCPDTTASGATDGATDSGASSSVVPSTAPASTAPASTAPAWTRTVTIRWDVIGTESVSVAINDVVARDDLPASGSLVVARPCPGQTVYSIAAENAAGRTVMSAQR